MCENLNLLVAGSNLRGIRIFNDSRLISNFIFALCKAASCRVRASVCEANLRLCVIIYHSNDNADDGNERRLGLA